MEEVQLAQPIAIAIKLVIVGESGSGKSSMVLRFSDDLFSPSFMSTIGIDFKIRTITVDKRVVKLQIWDTAGQEKFRSVNTSYYRHAMGIVIVYDITNKESVEQVGYWHETVLKNASAEIIMALVGTKVDLEENRQITYDDGYNLAKSRGIRLFTECSAKTGKNVDELFYTIARAVLESPAFIQRPPLSIEQKMNSGKSWC